MKKYFVILICMHLGVHQGLQAQQPMLHSVYFTPGSHTLQSKQQKTLDRLLIILKQRPFNILKIVGAADTSGTSSFNDRLSRKRAETVERYLKRKQYIPDKKTYVTWLGESTDGVYDLHVQGVCVQDRCVTIIIQ